MLKSQRHAARCGIALLSGTSILAAWSQGLAGRQQAYWLEPELLTLRVNQDQYRLPSHSIRRGGYFKVRALPKVRFKRGEAVKFTWKFEDSQGEFRGVPKFGDDGKFQLTSTKTLIYIIRPDFKLSDQPNEIKMSGKDVQWNDEYLSADQKNLGLSEPVIVGHDWLPAKPGNDRPVDEAILQIRVTQAID